MRRHSPSLAVERRQTLVRHLTVWVGFLCLFTEFSTTFHMLLVEHVRCAEHGEWVHADSAHQDEHGTVRSQASPDSPEIDASNREGEYGHNRDHCLICAERREVALSPSIVEPCVQDRDSDAALFGRKASAQRTQIYSFAPKTSPPA